MRGGACARGKVYGGMGIGPIDIQNWKTVHWTGLVHACVRACVRVCKSTSVKLVTEIVGGARSDLYA
jgi:hypothetical protein